MLLDPDAPSSYSALVCSASIPTIRTFVAMCGKPWRRHALACRQATYRFACAGGQLARDHPLDERLVDLGDDRGLPPYDQEDRDETDS